MGHAAGDASGQEREERLELALGLGELLGRTESRTIPQPAYRWAIAPRRSAQRSATQTHRPRRGRSSPRRPRTSPCRVPRAPGSAARRLPRLASDRGRGVEQPGQLERVERSRELCADRRGEVLDVLHLHEGGLLARGHPEAHRAERHARCAARRWPARAGPCRFAGAARPDRRPPPGPRCGASCRPRDPLGSLAVAAHQQLRAGSEEGQLRRAHAPAVAGGERRRRASKTGAGRVMRRVDAHLAREHDLSSSPRRCARPRARPRPRSATAAPRRPRGRAPRGRGRAAASARAQLPAARRAASRRRRRRGPGGHRQVVAPRTPAARGRGRGARGGGRERRPLGRCPPSCAKAKPPRKTGPAAGGRAGRRPDRRRRSAGRARERADASAKRSGPAPAPPRPGPSAASAKPSRSGCSKQAKRSSPRRAASTAAEVQLGRDAGSRRRRPCRPGAA